MDKSTHGDFGERQAVTYFGCHIGATDYLLANFEAVGGDHVSFRAVFVVKKRDTGRTVRVVLDALHDCGYIVILSLEVDKTQFSLVATAAVACRKVTR